MKPRKNKNLPDNRYCLVFFIFARANFPDSYIGQKCIKVLNLESGRLFLAIKL